MTGTDDPPAQRSAATTGWHGHKSCIVEIVGEAVGLLTAEGHGLVFHAASPDTWPLDRCVFSCRQDAEQAVRELLRVSRRKPEGFG